MSTEFTCLYESAFLPATDTTLHTADASGKGTILDKLTVCNNDSAAVTITVNVVANGGSVATSNQIVKTRSVGPAESFSLSEVAGQILKAGDFISAVASSASKLSVRLSGRKLT